MLSQVKKLFSSDVADLCACAVLAVVLYHFGVSSIPGGCLGVDIFYIFSGFYDPLHHE